MSIASAPGKIVLSGEYAVLFGAPAICMAVKRRAVASVAAGCGDECRVTTPGFTGQDSFAVIDAVYAAGRPACDIDLDTREFSSNGQKIGIGSSAALTVALAAASRNSTDVYAEAIAAHLRLQGGTGSGVDVATAVHGGLIRYEMASRDVQELSWPDGLLMRVVWTGVAASTGAKLQKLAEHSVQASRSALALAASAMADAWLSGSADRILSDYVSYVSVLRQFSVDHDLGIFDAGHDEIADAAVVNDLVYKPAGAGGGDIGVLFGRSTDELDAFVAQHSDRVYAVLPCDLDPDGVRLEPT